MTLSRMLSGHAPDITAIEAHLDQLGAAARRDEVLALSARAQARLFELARGHRSLRRDDLVPPEVPPLTGLAHQGRNSLPLVSRFAKIMCRPSPAHDEAGCRLWGYNESARGVQYSVGPGFFVARPYGELEMLVDYTLLPPERAPDWPELVPNTHRLSRFVFHGMQDVLRGVSQHVTIGRATKGGRQLPSWFVLVRD